MSKFDQSRWSDRNFSKEYREYADDYIPERYRMIDITKSLYKYFFKGKKKRLLDLGCGDGLIVNELLKINKNIEATLVDASIDMMDSARKRLADFENIRFINAGFQDIKEADLLNKNFDFVLSALAIHHLKMDEKNELFKYIYSHLNQGGLFLNIDVVLSPTDELENLYLTIWGDWINQNISADKKPALLPIPQKYKDNPDNTPDTLLVQLSALEKIGFKNVDCYYKYGIFTMFGGGK
jgi:tRNA (cmo5U34)-methyltransferase